jgi:hypothetical protein
MNSRSRRRTLSRHQTAVLIGAVLLNLAVLAVLVMVLSTPPPVALPVADDPTTDATCEAAAALSLRQQGVAASIVISRQMLLVNVTGPDAAAAWSVFSSTAQLLDAGCGPFNVVRVDVPDPEGRPDMRLVLELTGPEVQLWASGRLDDAQLSERTRRQIYQTAPPDTPLP